MLCVKVPRQDYAAAEKKKVSAAWQSMNTYMEEYHGEAALETGKYAVSGSGSNGKLPKTGRKTKYYYDRMGGDGLFFSGNGIHIRSEGAVFL